MRNTNTEHNLAQVKQSMLELERLVEVYRQHNCPRKLAQTETRAQEARTEYDIQLFLFNKDKLQ